MAFKKLDLIDPILKALVAEGYTTPTPIQAQSIPLILEGIDSELISNNAKHSSIVVTEHSLSSVLLLS